MVVAGGARAGLLVAAAVAAVAGCGGGSSTSRGSGSTTGSGPASPPVAAPADLPAGFKLAADLPTVVSHRLGRVGYRCNGPRRQLAVSSSGATEFIRFFDGRGHVRLAGDLDARVAHGPSLRTLRQSVQVILAVESGTAVVDVRVELARAPCEVSRMRVNVDSSSNLRPGSLRARRLDRLARLALAPHRKLGPNPSG